MFERVQSSAFLLSQTHIEGDTLKDTQCRRHSVGQTVGHTLKTAFHALDQIAVAAEFDCCGTATESIELRLEGRSGVCVVCLDFGFSILKF